VPAPEFQWIAYDAAEAAGPLSALLAAPAGMAAAPAIELPDMSAWPTPPEKAKVLLESAAEVEHALMVQYLYAAYSLKSADEVTDQAQKAALDESLPGSWPQLLLGIAREEMGHLMTVQDLLALLGMPPNLDREDFPPQKHLYPFTLHLEPLTQRSLAKYVVAEAPADAQGIDDIVALAHDAAGAPVNRVGVLYGLLGLIFTRQDQVQPGGSGDPAWDAVVRLLAEFAYKQAPPEAWSLADDAFPAGAGAGQADPQDWNVGGVRVHATTDRATAVAAIRDVSEQGEGPTSGGEQSHFQRFLGIYRGGAGMAAFPGPGDWVPTRAVPTDPTLASITEAATRRWAELADIRYALLLGFVEHYLLSSGDSRKLLTGWIFAEMRSRLGYIARALTAMPLGTEGAAAAVPFTLPAQLTLPATEPERWALHAERTQAAIAKVEEMQAAGDAGAEATYLPDLLASDRARLTLMQAAGGPQPPPVTTSFARDIQPLFRPKDIEHMAGFDVDLESYDGVTKAATAILKRVSSTGPRRMPPPPDPSWTAPQLQLFQRWIDEGFPK
jgi:hypothetical protein